MNHGRTSVRLDDDPAVDACPVAQRIQPPDRSSEIIRRTAEQLGEVTVVTVFTYFSLFCVPAITHAWWEPGPNNNGYSPDPMYERCHSQQFNIAPQTC